jgi:hypothetical protein
MSIISFASCLWTSDELVDEVRIPNYPWNSDIGKDLKKKKKTHPIENKWFIHFNGQVSSFLNNLLVLYWTKIHERIGYCMFHA